MISVARVKFQALSKSENQRIITAPPKKVLVFLQCFSFVYRNIVMISAYIFLQILEHHAVWLENLLQFTNSFDAPIHLGVRVIHFCSWTDILNLRNPEAHTREKREASISFIDATAQDIFARKYFDCGILYRLLIEDNFY
jgi:hypothetical protein